MFGVIDAHIHREFDLSDGGCWPFVARVVDAMTDSNHEQQLADYRNSVAVLRAMAEPGGVEAAVCSVLGAPSQGRPMRGDVVLFDGGEGDAVGIWDGKDIVAMGEAGLRRIPRSEIKTFWAVR